MSVEATQHETRKRKVRHTHEETTEWTSVRLAKVRAEHGKGQGKGKQGRDKSKNKDKNKDSIECWNCGKRGHYSKDCWSKKNTNKGGSKGKHKSKNATDAHNLDSTKSANVEPEVEIGEFDIRLLDVDALQQQESEWIKIGVDTGAGKTAWPQSVTYGKKLPVYCVLCTVYCVLCTVYCVLCTVYCVLCTSLELELELEFSLSLYL